MKSTRLDDLFVWCAYQPDRRIDFNGCFWRHPNGGVLIDPMPLSSESIEHVRHEGGVTTIVLTNADHLRAADTLKREFDAAVFAPAVDRELIGEGVVDSWYANGADLPSSLQADVAVHWLRGGKTEAEAVLQLRPLRALVFGDAVRSHASGVLRLLPESKVRDLATLVRDVRALREIEVEAVLLGDGDSLFTGAADAFRAFIDRL